MLANLFVTWPSTVSGAEAGPDESSTRAWLCSPQRFAEGAGRAANDLAQTAEREADAALDALDTWARTLPTAPRVAVQTGGSVLAAAEGAAVQAYTHVRDLMSIVYRGSQIASPITWLACPQGNWQTLSDVGRWGAEGLRLAAPPLTHDGLALRRQAVAAMGDSVVAPWRSDAVQGRVAKLVGRVGVEAVLGRGVDTPRGRGAGRAAAAMAVAEGGPLRLQPAGAGPWPANVWMTAGDGGAGGPRAPHSPPDTVRLGPRLPTLPAAADPVPARPLRPELSLDDMGPPELLLELRDETIARDLEHIADELTRAAHDRLSVPVAEQKLRQHPRADERARQMLREERAMLEREGAPASALRRNDESQAHLDKLLRQAKRRELYAGPDAAPAREPRLHEIEPHHLPLGMPWRAGPGQPLPLMDWEEVFERRAELDVFGPSTDLHAMAERLRAGHPAVEPSVAPPAAAPSPSAQRPPGRPELQSVTPPDREAYVERTFERRMAHVQQIEATLDAQGRELLRDQDALRRWQARAAELVDDDPASDVLVREHEALGERLYEVEYLRGQTIETMEGDLRALLDGPSHADVLAMESSERLRRDFARQSAALDAEPVKERVAPIGVDPARDPMPGDSVEVLTRKGHDFFDELDEALNAYGDFVDTLPEEIEAILGIRGGAETPNP